MWNDDASRLECVLDHYYYYAAPEQSTCFAILGLTVASGVRLHALPRLRWRILKGSDVASR
jgi:hypothetical protein